MIFINIKLAENLNFNRRGSTTCVRNRRYVACNFQSVTASYTFSRVKDTRGCQNVVFQLVAAAIKLRKLC